MILRDVPLISVGARGLERRRESPARWTGQSEGIEWKRDLHQRPGTKFLETIWAEAVLQ